MAYGRIAGIGKNVWMIHLAMQHFVTDIMHVMVQQLMQIHMYFVMDYMVVMKQKEITSTYNVWCTGNRGCKGVGSITAGATVYCDGSYSCTDITGNIEGEIVTCNGDHSCQDSYIVVEEGTLPTAYCDGNYGCYGATVTARILYYVSLSKFVHITLSDN